ncbi:hypothetical protein V5P93_004021 [Actinokineospora auranticolor]|uniref:Uncharacterized protein n=1 Tax=Actinokineospora auranticolor TaxID=155976 RepID=A0A2S6GCT8_9PSEU|nr:hypothetical protein [Actinokineospora auranticolor]PPK62765.1 hypothetical protein CLV40_13331 [Actinokineospora auranticolor]
MRKWTVAKWTAVACALVAAIGIVGPASAAPAERKLTGVWTLRVPNGPGLLDRDGSVGLGDPAAATRWRFVQTGARGDYLIRTDETLRGWTLPEAGPGAAVRVGPLNLLPTDPRTLRWTVHLSGSAAAAVISVTINSAVNGWPVVPGGDYDPHLVVVPETFAPVTYLATKVSN